MVLKVSRREKQHKQEVRLTNPQGPMPRNLWKTSLYPKPVSQDSEERPRFLGERPNSGLGPQLYTGVYRSQVLGFGAQDL